MMSTETSFKTGVRGIKFNAIGKYGRTLITAITSIILARILPPFYFGIVGLALFYSSLLNRVKSFKFNPALLHRKEKLREARSTHFFLHLFFGFIPLFGSLLLFYALRDVYNPLMLTILLVLTLKPIFVSIGSTPKTILQEQLRFKSLSISTILSAAVSCGISLFLAWRGFGICSLVAYHVLERIIRNSFYWVFTSWRPKLAFNKELVKYYLTFGGILLISSQFSFLYSKFNQFAVGTFVSVSALAFYNRAYSFTKYSRFLTAPIIKTAKPLFARSQENERVLSKTYNYSLSGITHLSWPFSVALFLVAPTFIEFLVGSKWLPATPIFRLLLPTTLTLPITGASTKLCNMLGRPKRTLKVKVLQGILIPLSLPLINIFGVNGAAISVGIASIIGLITFFQRYLPEEVRISYKKVFIPPIFAIFLAYGVYFISKNYLPLSTFFPSSFLFVELIYKMGTFLMSYFVFLLAIERERLLKIIKRIYRALI